MSGINWKVRFNKNNLAFIVRFVAALLIPVLAYLGINWEDLNTWRSVGAMLHQFITNPYLVVLTITNAINLIPDGTTKGLFDSKQALEYKEPKKDK